MKRWLNEPLVHFLLIGAALFVVFGLAGKRTSATPGTIVVTKGQIASMVSGFTSTWQRPPTQDELEALIQDRVREEVYCREAVALGLDKDDTVIRRRLRQKMEFISDDLVAELTPSDAELDAYLKAHREDFQSERRFTFRHVYLSPEKHGNHLSQDAARLMAQLAKSGVKADVSQAGDTFLLPHDFDAVPADELTKVFGERFVAKLGELAPGRWEGPVESGFGVHLVFLEARTDNGVPELPAVRDRVRREWADAKRLEANEAFYQDLLRKYAVTIERP